MPGALAKMGKAAQVAIPDLKAVKQVTAHPRLQEVVDIAIRSIESATD